MNMIKKYNEKDCITQRMKENIRMINRDRSNVNICIVREEWHWSEDDKRK